jgi:hypothetical protein
MRFSRHTLGGFLLALAVGGCAAPVRQTHDPHLLDNHVLQQRVEAALRRAGADFKEVRAQAAGGTVELTGQVASEAARGRADEVARGVYGVNAVRDDLQVAGDGR